MTLSTDSQGSAHVTCPRADPVRGESAPTACGRGAPEEEGQERRSSGSFLPRPRSSHTFLTARVDQGSAPSGCYGALPNTRPLIIVISETRRLS